MLLGCGTRRAAPGNRLKVSGTDTWSSLDLFYLLQPLRVRGWLGAGAAWRADTQAPTGSLAEKNLGEMRFVVDIITAIDMDLNCQIQILQCSVSFSACIFVSSVLDHV